MDWLNPEDELWGVSQHLIPERSGFCWFLADTFHQSKTMQIPNFFILEGGFLGGQLNVPIEDSPVSF